MRCGLENMTVLHEKLMNLYNEHVIGGWCLFPGAGFVEISVVAGARYRTYCCEWHIASELYQSV